MNILVQIVIYRLLQQGNGIFLPAPKSGRSRQQCGIAVFGVDFEQVITRFYGPAESPQAQLGFDQHVAGIAVAGHMAQNLTAQIARFVQIHSRSRPQGQFGQQQMGIQRVRMLLQHLIGQSPGFEGTAGECQKPGLENPRLGAALQSGGKPHRVRPGETGRLRLGKCIWFG